MGHVQDLGKGTFGKVEEIVDFMNDRIIAVK